MSVRGSLYKYLTDINLQDSQPFHPSIGRVWADTHLIEYILVAVAVGRGAPGPAFSSLRGLSLQALTFFG